MSTTKTDIPSRKGAAYSGVCVGCGKEVQAALLIDYEAVNVPNTLDVGCHCGLAVSLPFQGAATLVGRVNGYLNAAPH